METLERKSIAVTFYYLCDQPKERQSKYSK